MTLEQAQRRYDALEPDFSAHYMEDSIDEKMVDATRKFTDAMSIGDFQDFFSMIDRREVQAIKDALVDGDSLEIGEIIARYFQENYRAAIREIAKEILSKK